MNIVKPLLRPLGIFAGGVVTGIAGTMTVRWARHRRAEKKKMVAEKKVTVTETESSTASAS